MKKFVVFIFTLTLLISCSKEELKIFNQYLNTLSDIPEHDQILSERQAMRLLSEFVIEKDAIDTIDSRYGSLYNITPGKLVLVEDFISNRYYYLGSGYSKEFSTLATLIQIDAKTGISKTGVFLYKEDQVVAMDKNDAILFFNNHIKSSSSGDLKNIKAILLSTGYNGSPVTGWLWCVETENDQLFLIRPFSESINGEKNIAPEHVFKSGGYNNRLYQITDEFQKDLIRNFQPSFTRTGFLQHKFDIQPIE